ncbi:MAG TPA: ATP synthase subunit F [Clostridiales bacterium]|nr:ATP synthase subunit F [Clostridiales bacterium]
MRTCLISDNHDIKIGMRLAGIEGFVARTREEILRLLEELIEEGKAEIIIITEKAALMVEDELMKMKTDRDLPLIVEIPSPDIPGRRDYILRYIKESIGLKI